MKCKQWASGVLISAVASWGAQAQTAEPGADDQAELDVIMSIVDEDDTPDEVFQRIELPPATENVTTPEIQLDEEVESITRDLGELVDDATTTVTETLKGALSSGDISEIPDDISETIPDEVIDDLINDSTDEIDGVVDDIDDAVDDLDDIDDTIDPVDDTLKGSTGKLDDAIKEVDESVRKTDEIINEMDDISSDAESISNDADSIDLDSAIDNVTNGL